MRVLTITNMYPPHHYGGYELLCQEVVAAMRAGGHEVIVLTSDIAVPGVVATAVRRRDLKRVDLVGPAFIDAERALERRPSPTGPSTVSSCSDGRTTRSVYRTGVFCGSPFSETAE